MNDWDARNQHRPQALISWTISAPADWTKKPIARQELPCLAGIASADERFYLRCYLRSNIETDHDIAKARCAAYGIDYEQARGEARGAH